MKYIPGHLKKQLHRWTGKQWYHQRFDGSPYFMHMIAEAEIAFHEARKRGGSFSVHYCFYDNGKADWYIAMDDIKKVYSAVIEAGKKDPDIGKTFMQEWSKDEGRFQKQCIAIANTDIASLDDAGLMRLHDESAEITLNRNSSSSLIDGFALGTDEMIASEIRKAYDTIQSKIRFNEVFSILTAPVHPSFINEAEVSLLRIAEMIEQQNKKSIFERSVKEVKQAIKGTAIENEIAKHQQRYFWTRNNYVNSYILSTDHFIEELRSICSANINVRAEIKRITETAALNQQKKAELMKHLTLPEQLKTLIRISECFTQWQDERKKATFLTIHHFSLILQEVSNRTGIPLEELKYMTCREVSTIFKKKPERKELQARKKKSVYFWDRQGMETVTGKEADNVNKTILGEQSLDDVDDFRGLTACPGNATGKVKILKSATEINKIERGDILVAVMTRPDYVPAMKKAAAIVTDEGGITCHAAIVSRELGIPCIIGTKIATKVLKDGDYIQVDANHAMVRKIKNG